MDTTDPSIEFDDAGVCDHCHAWDAWAAGRPPADVRAAALEDLAGRVRARAARSEFGCVIGISGGVDSAMVALRCAELGLRPLAVHLDNGWDSEEAVRNIESTCRTLGIPLITKVLDWERYRRLQLAFLFAGVIDADIPADHAIVATVYRTAVRHRVPWIISGNNEETERVLPRAWVWPKTDLRHLRAVAHVADPSLHIDARWFPTLSTSQRLALSRSGLRWLQLLDFTGQDKASAKARLQRDLGWVDYGGKHHESVWTRWFQATYLRRRFGVEKRRAHLASLVLADQMTRAEALAELTAPEVSPDRSTIDTWYVAQKLGLSDAQLDAILDAPGRPHAAFATERTRLEPLRPIAARLGFEVY
jgi:hypothetical protein